MFKKSLMVVILVSCMVLLSGCGNEGGSSNNASLNEEEFSMDTFEFPNPELPVVLIEVEGHGQIVAELYPEYAPITVHNFIGLVEDGFYDGLTFHRIMDGFMIQGGCPLGTGTGGSGEMISGEFADNGIENPLSHTRGVLSMARSWEHDSASSQFFIMHGTERSLDGAYAAFGKVISGMEVVDSVVSSVTPLDGNGTIDPDEHPVITEIRLINGEQIQLEDYLVTDEDDGFASDDTFDELSDVDIDDVLNLELPVVSIYIEGHGEIIAELYPEYAPITVWNFVELVEDGFYDGLTFHRIIDGFMMQGGCPLGTGTGGSGETIIGEFADNGIENPLRHTRGVLSMARSMEHNSASSQFFIMHQESPWLDDAYAGFGRVIYGMRVVDSVIASVIPLDGNGTIAPDDHPVIREIQLINNPRSN